MANPEHLAKLMEGVVAWNRWRDANPKIVPDLLEADLKQHVLSNAHFEGANLDNAHLEEADLSYTHLEGASLSRAHIEMGILLGAHLERSNLLGAQIQEAFLTGAHIEGADLRGANLADANVTALSYLMPLPPQQTHIPFSLSSAARRFWRWLSRNPIPYRKRLMRGRYQGIRGLSSCNGNRIFVRDAADQDYLDTVESQLNSRWGRFWFWVWGLTDYGRSFLSIVVFASLLIFGFGSAYSHWPQIISAGNRTPTPFTPYYFSIVTYTTLGFGDVKPNSMSGEILVSIEVIMGYLTLGLLLAVLGDKIARRS